jgi:hypothetical protein
MNGPVEAAKGDGVGSKEGSGMAMRMDCGL